MDYDAKSVIIDRKKDKQNPNKDMPYNVEVKFFAINNPHMTDEVPLKSLEYENINSVIIRNCDVNFLPRGADILINDLKKVAVEQDKQGNIIVRKIK